MATYSDPFLRNLLRHLQALAFPDQAAVLEHIARTGTFNGKWVLEEFPTMKHTIERVVDHLSGGASLPGGPVDLFQGSRYALRLCSAAVYAYLCWRHAAHIGDNARAEFLKQLVEWCLAKHPGRHAADPAFMVQFATLADCVCGAIDPAHEIGIIRDACNLLSNRCLKDMKPGNGFERDSKGKFKRAPGTWAGGSPPAFVRSQLEILWALTGFTPKQRKRECVSPGRARRTNKRARRDSNSDSDSSRSGGTTIPSASSSDDEAESIVFDEDELADFQLQFEDMFQPQPVSQEQYVEQFTWLLDDAALVPTQYIVADNHPSYAQSAYERTIDNDFAAEDLQFFEMLADTTVQELNALLNGHGNF